MFALTIPVLLALVGIGINLARLGVAIWDNARSKAMVKWLEDYKVRLEARREAQKAKNKAIDAEPDKHGDDLTNDLNDTFRGKP